MQYANEFINAISLIYEEDGKARYESFHTCSETRSRNHKHAGTQKDAPTSMMRNRPASESCLAWALSDFDDQRQREKVFFSDETDSRNFMWSGHTYLIRSCRCWIEAEF